MSKSKLKDPIDLVIDLYKVIPEPRVKGRCKHNLVDILVIVTCAYLCGISEWEEVEMFAHEREEWLRKYLELPSGIPSHDTLLRVFKLIDPGAFELIFLSWIQSVIQLKEGQVIAFDGKRVSGTYPFPASKKGQSLSLLNIWAVDNGITLGQMKISATGFPEAMSIKECLDYMNIQGCIVTTDAGSSFTSVAEKIVRSKADYLLPIKKSKKAQSKALDKIYTGKVDKKKFVLKEEKRGREEIRIYEVIHDKKIIDEFCQTYKWPELKTIGVVNYTRKIPDKRVVKQELQKDGSWRWVKVDGSLREIIDQKFYLSSLKMTPKKLMTTARSHWELENKLNWQLDVSFKEDANRTRETTAAENMSMVRKICLNLLKSETTSTKSIKHKMTKCVLNEGYLEKVLFKL